VGYRLERPCTSIIVEIRVENAPKNKPYSRKPESVSSRP